MLWVRCKSAKRNVREDSLNWAARRQGTAPGLPVCWAQYIPTHAVIANLDSEF